MYLTVYYSHSTLKSDNKRDHSRSLLKLYELMNLSSRVSIVGYLELTSVASYNITLERDISN